MGTTDTSHYSSGTPPFSVNCTECTNFVVLDLQDLRYSPRIGIHETRPRQVTSCEQFYMFAQDATFHDTH